jgi:outer membrane cobalamin receptor
MPKLLLLSCVILISACATASGTGAPAATAGSHNVITREEIARSGFVTMEEVITRLRPQFLRGRGQSTLLGGADRVIIYMDNTQLGTASALRGITADIVVRVEFISGPDTSFRFGMNHPAGVIHIITRQAGL